MRVSPFSAGGEGLCKARFLLLKRPGKLAEGIQQQLGFFFCRCSTCSRRFRLYSPSCSGPWGSRLRPWKFKYKLVRFRRKRFCQRIVGVASDPHGAHTMVSRGQLAIRDSQGQRHTYSSRAMPARMSRPGRLSFLIFISSCNSVCGMLPVGAPPGAAPIQPQASGGGKRAWIRAQRQASQQGYAWYRGRVIRSAEIPHHLATQPPRRPKRQYQGTTRRGATARLKIMTLNVGHMSAFLWSELKAYLASSACEYDVMCLQELHWSQTCQFCVGGWSAVVSAGSDRSDGVMVLVNPKFKQSQVKFDEIIRGKLLRVQIAVADARVEVFCCYQFVWQTELTKEDNLRRRQIVLDKLSVQVKAIAKRSTVVVVGDFNAELVSSPGRVGQSLANTPRHVGPEAPSPHALTRALEDMELIALNTWCSRSPHTNFTSTGKSQIDFIWVREASADREARMCQPTDPAIGSWRYMGHKKLEASIRLIKHYHKKDRQGSTKTCYQSMPEPITPAFLSFAATYRQPCPGRGLAHQLPL